MRERLGMSSGGRVSRMIVSALNHAKKAVK
jgi:hypothetical protein